MSLELELQISTWAKPPLMKLMSVKDDLGALLDLSRHDICFNYNMARLLIFYRTIPSLTLILGHLFSSWWELFVSIIRAPIQRKAELKLLIQLSQVLYLQPNLSLPCIYFRKFISLWVKLQPKKRPQELKLVLKICQVLNFQRHILFSRASFRPFVSSQWKLVMSEFGTQNEKIIRVKAGCHVLLGS